MNIQTKPSINLADVPDAERQARVDLAAVYRLCAHYGWDDVIYNHCAMRVPGEDGKFLMKRHESLWTEVTASNLVKVDMHDDLDESAGVNRPGFTLHGGVLKGRPDVNCSVHVHTETLAGRLDDPDVGLVGDDELDVVHAHAGVGDGPRRRKQRRRRSLQHRRDRMRRGQIGLGER